MALTYTSYLKVEELLELQQPLSDGPQHDEMLFIVIHQTYELWFKQILHEVDHLSALLDADELYRGLHTIGRIRAIMKVLVHQMDILETMTPLEFLSFRDRLETASGFQSAQFRELELALGHKRKGPLEQFPAGSPERTRLDRRFAAPCLWDAFLAYAARQGHPIPTDQLERDVTAPVESVPALQPVLVELFREDSATATLAERFVDLDEGLQEWRYRHVKMVERTLGAKPGTGGSSGVEYLKSTLFAPVFPDLWAIRSQLERS